MGILASRSKTLLPLLAAALIFTVWALVAKPGFIAVMAGERQIPIYSVKREYRVVSLTFDAAWGNEDTEALIGILGRYNIKATFFVVGDWARKYPESVRQLSDAGHEIMSHSDRHEHMTRLSPSQISADLKACNDAVEAVTGVRPALFRCPYGEYDDNVVRAARDMGMEVIQWDVDSLDWMDKTAAQIQERVLGGVGPGSIVLFHNAAKHTPEALEGIITGLMREGYSFARVSELLLTENYSIDNSGMQIPAR